MSPPERDASTPFQRYLAVHWLAPKRDAPLSGAHPVCDRGDWSLNELCDIGSRSADGWAGARMKKGRPPKWSAWKWERRMASIAPGSTPNRFIAESEVAPQSMRNR